MNREYMTSLAILLQLVLYACPLQSIAQEQKTATPASSISSERVKFKRELDQMYSASALDQMDDVGRAQQFAGEVRRMDPAILQELNGSRVPSTTRINEELEKWKVSRPLPSENPPSESYEVLGVKSDPPWYVLVANLADVSALRIYSKKPSESNYSFRVALDPNSVEGYVLGYEEFVPVDEKDGVFLTIHGRFALVEEKKVFLLKKYGKGGWASGFYKAWHFDGESVKAVWEPGGISITLDKVLPDGIMITRCENARFMRTELAAVTSSITRGLTVTGSNYLS